VSVKFLSEGGKISVNSFDESLQHINLSSLEKRLFISLHYWEASRAKITVPYKIIKRAMLFREVSRLILFNI
jgi:hypothetical protein